MVSILERIKGMKPSQSSSPEVTIGLKGQVLQPAGILQEFDGDCCDMLISSPSDTLSLIHHMAEKFRSQVYDVAQLTDKEAAYHANVASIFNYRLNKENLECIASTVASIQSSLGLLESASARLTNLASSFVFHQPYCKARTHNPLGQQDRGPTLTSHPPPSTDAPALVNSSVSSDSIESMAEKEHEEESHEEGKEGRETDSGNTIVESVWGHLGSSMSWTQPDNLGAHLQATSECPNHNNTAISATEHTGSDSASGPSLVPKPKPEKEKKVDVEAGTGKERKMDVEVGTEMGTRENRVQVSPLDVLMDMRLISLPSTRDVEDVEVKMEKGKQEEEVRVCNKEGKSEQGGQEYVGAFLQREEKPEVAANIEIAMSPENEEKGGNLPPANMSGESKQASRRRKPEQKVEGDYNTWRKYGEKKIKGAPFYRSYYKCAYDSTCLARREVDRLKVDLTVVRCEYVGGLHSHPDGAKKKRATQTNRALNRALNRAQAAEISGQPH